MTANDTVIHQIRFDINTIVEDMNNNRLRDGIKQEANIK